MARGDEVYRIGSWRAYAAELPWVTAARLPLELSRSALIVVDMTRYQCDRDAPAGIARSLYLRGGRFAAFYFASMAQVVPAIRSLIDFFRLRGAQVVFLTAGPLSADGRELPFFLRRVDTGLQDATRQPAGAGAEPHAVIPDLAPQPGDLVLHKITSSGFVGTGLDLMLRNMGIDTIILTGAATHACVEATARSGADLGFKIVLAEDGCLTQSPLFHDMTMMYCLQFNWGRVLRSEEIMAELAADRGPVEPAS